MSTQFKALIIDQEGEGLKREIKSVDQSFLKHGDVLVKVDYSCLNYKDALILNNGARLVKEYPHIPGIDFSGTVVDSESDKFKKDDDVILTGWRVGEIFYGGYSQFAKVNSDFLVKRPKDLNAKQSMIMGTAGLTALLCAFAIKAREELLLGEKVNDVLVTGASGGVGSIAVMILAKFGYNVTAVTGKKSNEEYLKTIGAKTVINKEELDKVKDKKKRGFYLSAARSYLFNYLVSQRISNNTFMHPVAGDVFMLAGTQSVFLAEEIDRMLGVCAEKKEALGQIINLGSGEEISIAELAKEILWSKSIPVWGKILRLLQIKSCNIEQIESILKISRNEITEEIEKLRKNQFVLMSPQRLDEKLIKVYEILPEGIEVIDKTETGRFEDTKFGDPRPEVEVLSIIDEIGKEIQDSQLEQTKKDSINEKLSRLKDKLEI